MPEIIDRIKAIASQNKIKIRNTITSRKIPPQFLPLQLHDQILYTKLAFAIVKGLVLDNLKK
jgi:hypothetical protein